MSQAIGNWEVSHNHGWNYALLFRKAWSSIIYHHRDNTIPRTLPLPFIPIGWAFIIATTVTRIVFVQWFGQAWILSTPIVNELTSFFARYVLVRTLFGFGSNQPKIRSWLLKLPSDQLYLAFKVNSSSMKRSTVQCLGHPIDRSYTLSSVDFLTVSKFIYLLALPTNSPALVWRNN